MSERIIWLCLPTSAIAIEELGIFLNSPMVISGYTIRKETEEKITKFHGGQIIFSEKKGVIRSLKIPSPAKVRIPGISFLCSLLRKLNLEDFPIERMEVLVRNGDYGIEGNYILTFKKNTLKDRSDDDPFKRFLKSHKVIQRAIERGLQADVLDLISYAPEPKRRVAGGPIMYFYNHIKGKGTCFLREDIQVKKGCFKAVKMEGGG